MKTFDLTGMDLKIEDVYNIAFSMDTKVQLSSTSLEKMKTSRAFIFEIVEKGNPVYGINTGFGALSNKFIDKKDLEQLQINLIRSHCTGVGEYLDRETTRALMLLRANCLASGFSGINPELVLLLLDLLNHDILPAIPGRGSVGASGDLAPLAHMALPLIGEGEVFINGVLSDAKDGLKLINKNPIKLGPKDGLALINGTALMASMACLNTYKAELIMKTADIAATLTLEGVRGTNTAYSPLISNLKPHRGQLDCVSNLNNLTANSEIMNSHKECLKVQDPYSLRCVPQVHGACRQTLNHSKEVVSVEVNSVTDNPLVYPQEKTIISGGNFHGEALALCMDYLSMGVSEIANISERRIEKMMNPSFSELPAFLTKESGINSGLMIVQVTAAALVSENKTLCFPASVDSVPTSTDKEDHVSMGPNAGRKLTQIIENTINVLAVELLCAACALDFQRPLKTSKALESVHQLIREVVPPLKEDRILYKDIRLIADLIKSGKIINRVNEIIGELK